MKAAERPRRRIPFSEVSFAELVPWQGPPPLVGSPHSYKYRLAYAVQGVCVLRYDNESAKGTQRHFKGKASRFAFESPESLVEAFQRDIARYRREDSDA